jgi:hypothetical protein
VQIQYLVQYRLKVVGLALEEVLAPEVEVLEQDTEVLQVQQQTAISAMMVVLVQVLLHIQQEGVVVLVLSEATIVGLHLVLVV